MWSMYPLCTLLIFRARNRCTIKIFCLGSFFFFFWFREKCLKNPVFLTGAKRTKKFRFSNFFQGSLTKKNVSFEALNSFSFSSSVFFKLVLTLLFPIGMLGLATLIIGYRWNISFMISSYCRGVGYLKETMKWISVDHVLVEVINIVISHIHRIISKSIYWPMPDIE